MAAVHRRQYAIRARRKGSRRRSPRPRTQHQRLCPRPRPPRPPGVRSTAGLFRDYAAGQLCARDELIETYLPMARRMGRTMRLPGATAEDLEQVASVALVKAVDRFDPRRGAFVAYAVSIIRGELKRELRDRGWAVRVARPLKERHVRVREASERLRGEWGRPPGPNEVAADLGLSEEEVTEAFAVALALRADSLDAPPPGEDTVATGLDALAVRERGYEAVERRMVLGPALERLSARDRAILSLHFREGLTQSAIAELIGVSQMQISRLLRRALDRMSQEMVGVSESGV